MISRQSLLKINGLKLDGIIDSMDEEMFEEYCKELKTFIDEYPKQEAVLKDSFACKNFNEFTKELLSVMHTLKKIRAYDLEKSCVQLLSDVRTQNAEVAEAFLNYLVTSITMLSIDIQIIMYQKTVEVAPEQPVTQTVVKVGAPPKKILAVDDVSLILNILKTTLQDTPHKFIGVTSGAAALRFLENNDPSLFLLDIEMPEMNGYELAKKIREMKKTAPIIFLTGNATAEYVEKAIKVGAADFIVKPVNKEQVLEKIKKFLR